MIEQDKPTSGWRGLPAAPGVSRSILLLQILYVVGLSLWSMAQGIFPSPELLFLLLLTAFVWKTPYRAFLLDFAPFLFLLLSYQALRGFADNLTFAEINVENLIAWERALFNGIIPSAYLQATLLDRPFTPLLNVISNFFYMSHYVVPIVVALLLWFRRLVHYWPFVLGLIALSYAAFLTYVLFPAAPPWWAAYYGYLPEGTVALTNFVLPTVLVFAGPNPVAAMPSLHAAYPTYIALFATATWGWRGAWLWVFPLGVSFAAVYLGHHYVIDLLAGMGYGLVFFLVSQQWMRLRRAAAENGGA